MASFTLRMFSRIPPIIVVSLISLPFFLIPGWEIIRFIVLTILLMAYFLYLYYFSKKIERTETSLDLISGIAGIVAIFFVVVDLMIVDFERKVSAYTYDVTYRYSWVILNLEEIDEFCLQCIQSKNAGQCEGYYKPGPNRVKLSEDPRESGFNYDAHIETCNLYKHFRLQMEQQIREEYIIGRSNQSIWKANLCSGQGLDGESKERLCGNAAAYDKSLRNRDDFIESINWYPAAMFVKSLKGFNWTLFLAIFAGLKAARAISKFRPPE